MITQFFFERPVLLATTCGVFGVACLFRWANRRDRSSTRAVWITLVAACVLPAISSLVVTDRERIIESCEGFARAIDEGDVAAIGTAISDDFSAGDLDREAFLRRVERVLTRYRFDHPRLWGFEIKFPEKGRAMAELSASAQLRSAEAIWDRLPTRWRVMFRLVGDNWRVARIESLPIPPLNLKTPDEWLR